MILLHLLKWQFQPEGRSVSWAASLLEQRDQLGSTLSDSPSLRSYPRDVVDKQYRIARLKAAGETKLPLDAFPEANPYSLQEILDEGFLPAEKGHPG